MYLSTNQMAACLAAATLAGSSILVCGYAAFWIVLAIILTMGNHIVNNRSEDLKVLEKDLLIEELQDLAVELNAGYVKAMSRMGEQKAIIADLEEDLQEERDEVACRTETNERLQNRNIILEDEVEVLDSLVLEEREEALFAESFSTAAIRQRNEARREVAVQKTEIAELRGELQSTLRNLDGQTSMALCFLDTAGELEQELEEAKAAGNTLAKSVPCTSRKAANAVAHFLGIEPTSYNRLIADIADEVAGL